MSVSMAGWPDWPIFSQFRETGKFEMRLAGKFLAWEILKNWPKTGKFGHPWETSKNLGFFSKILGKFWEILDKIVQFQKIWQQSSLQKYEFLKALDYCTDPFMTLNILLLL